MLIFLKSLAPGPRLKKVGKSVAQVKINKTSECEIVIICLSISFNICFGCTAVAQSSLY